MAGSTDRPELLTKRDVCTWLRVNERTLRRWCKLGTFPPPVYLQPGRHAPRWRREDAEAWLTDREHLTRPAGESGRPMRNA